jgi:hypothetical protein
MDINSYRNINRNPFKYTEVAGGGQEKASVNFNKGNLWIVKKYDEK